MKGTFRAMEIAQVMIIEVRRGTGEWLPWLQEKADEEEGRRGGNGMSCCE